MYFFHDIQMFGDQSIAEFPDTCMVISLEYQQEDIILLLFIWFHTSAVFCLHTSLT